MPNDAFCSFVLILAFLCPIKLLIQGSPFNLRSFQVALKICRHRCLEEKKFESLLMVNIPYDKVYIVIFLPGLEQCILHANFRRPFCRHCKYI